MAEALDDEIAHLYDCGWSTRQIAKHLNYSQNTILRSLARQSVPIRGRGGNQKQIPEIDMKRTIFLYCEVGLSIADTAKLLCVSKHCVHGRLVKAGIQLRPPGSAGRRLVKRRVA
jgi:transposase